MITVVIPTLNEARRLPPTLASLVPAVIDGVVKQVIVVDGGSTDATRAIADDAGADVIYDLGLRGRGPQFIRGIEAARGSWLLLLHADTVLEPDWHRAAAQFITDATGQGKAAAFAFAVDDRSWQARLLTLGVKLRCAVFKLPYGDQGLLISRQLYCAVGGFRPLPLFEDVDLVRRLGRSRIEMLNVRAVTSADRYRAQGYARRIGRNLSCLARYFIGGRIDRIAERYSR